MSILAPRGARTFLLLLLTLFPAPALFAAYTVTGKFVYEDREFDLEGFTGVIKRRPIRFADVRILANDSTVAKGTTGADGEFLISVPSLVVPSLSALCITSSAQSAPLQLNVRVANNDYSFGDYYAVSSETYPTPGPSGLVTMGTIVARADTDIGKAFNIWDVLIDGLEFVNSSQVQGSLPSESLTAIWRETHSQNSSFFQGARNKYIYVGSIAPWNDNVIAHEFGHFIDALYSKSDSPGGPHYLGDDMQDIRLSWAEGLATFLGCSMRKFKGYPRPDIYVSTDGTNLSFSYELESLTGDAVMASTTGSTNETAVSAALWDITDGRQTDDATAGIDDDPLERPFAEVWRDLTQYMPAVTSHDLNVEDFWDGWFAMRNGGSLIDLQTVFAEINGIEFVPDPLEADDTVAEAPEIRAGYIAPLLSGGRVLINELNVGGVDSIELYNAGNREVDLTGWTIIAGARTFPTVVLVIPSFKLAPGEFVLLSEAAGSNTNATLYFNRNISWANGTDGACALIDNYGAARDFVRWGDSTMPPPAGTGFHGPNAVSPSTGKDLCRSFASGDTDTADDWSEQSPSLGTFNLGGNVLHYTYYPTMDFDLAAFTAQAGAVYLAETFNLANGAHTVLEILAADGVTVLESSADQPNLSGSGSLRWTAPAGGRYYIRSRRFDGATNLARYGSYDLRILTREPLRVAKEAAPFNAIAVAVAAAAFGDTIEIQDSGIYHENIVITGKNLTLRAARGQNPVVDGSEDPTRPVLELNAENVRIEGIRVRNGAPGVRVSGGTATLVNTVVYQASVPSRDADGIRIEGPFASAALIHCTIAGNPGLGVGVFRGASARIVNSIIGANGTGDLSQDGTAASLIVQYSLIESGHAADSDGNLGGDPKFADRNAGDFHLDSSSPAIDRGDTAAVDMPGSDAAGLTRSLDGDHDGTAIPDMGAYEFLPLDALASSSLYPQVAVGGGYRTSLVAVNPGAQDAQVRWDLFGSDGRLLSGVDLTTPGGRPPISIPPLGMVRLEAGATGDALSGYAKFLGSLPIGGAALFQVIRGDRITSEAGVGLAQPTGRFTIYVDNTRGARSGYALANPGNRPANLQLTVRDQNGLPVTSAAFQLAAGGHIAEFAAERFPAVADGFEGTIECSSDEVLHAVALRYDNDTMDAFCTIPVLAEGLAPVLYFPQVADGAGYRTNLILMNPGDRVVTARVEFFSADGSPVGLPLGGFFRTSLSLVISPRGSASLFTDGISSQLGVGWARVTCTDPIGGSTVIQTRTASQVISEAGAAASLLAKRSLSYLDGRGFARSGVAICNPGLAAITLNLRLHDTAGKLVGARNVVLPGFGQVAKFFTEWFPLIQEGFEGTLEISSPTPVVAVALRFDNPLADVFAALPVVVIR